MPSQTREGVPILFMRVYQGNFINELNKEIPVSILKCKIIPSQCINSKPYDVWAVVQKNKPNEPGGYIHSAYCTCTGILGTCNHITRMFLGIENAVQSAVTKSKKPGVLCARNIPKGQTVDTTVKPVWDLVFEESVYIKPKSKLAKLANYKKKYLDFFTTAANQEKLQDKKDLRNSLFPLLQEHISLSCFVLTVKSKITKNSSMKPQISLLDPPETAIIEQ